MVSCLFFRHDPSPGFTSVTSIKAEKESREGEAPRRVCLGICSLGEKTEIVTLVYLKGTGNSRQ